MARVRILPDILSNKIAAGEVVERPASVVKELVENALDAGADRITVEVERGGRSTIQVADNGAGMSHDDALLAIERYATSKIVKDDDLFAIGTLGFRGEALPSIAAVSRFVMETRVAEDETGTRIDLEGGKLRDVSRIGAPPGTLVTVRNLFFNTPARRKFLKAINTEMGHIADTVASIALGWPGVRFRLTHNGRIVKDWPAADPSRRVTDVLGRDVEGRLRPVEKVNGEIRISGWAADPAITRTTARSTYIFVNGRWVKDRLIGHALAAGYSGRLMKGQYPVAVLSLTTDPHSVDVNVHPTKSEVRFVQGNRIHEAVRSAVAEALQGSDRPGARRPIPPSSRPDRDTLPDSDPPPPILRSDQVQESPTDYPPPEPVRGSPEPRADAAPAPGPESLPGPAEAPRTRPDQAPIWEGGGFADLRVIGQFRGTYILCEAPDGLLIIDQHAAHERVLFERFRSRSSPAGGASQGLLVPETVDLSYTEARIIEHLMPALADRGLVIEPFGGRTMVVKSAPAPLADREMAPLIREMAEEIAQEVPEAASGEGLDRALAAGVIRMACHGAIRAGRRLSESEIKALLAQLDRCENPGHCPHGRPTWIRWDQRFFEKSFGRVA